MLRFVCLFLLVALSAAGKVKFEDCGSKNVQEVRLDQCDSDPCVLHKGKPLTIEVDFTSNQDSNKANFQILAKVGEVDLPLPIEHDACIKDRLHCPLKNGEKYTLKYTLNIPKATPTMSTSVTAKLVGDHGTIGCGKVHGEIKD